MYMDQYLKSFVIESSTTFAAEHINIIVRTTYVIEWKMTCKECQTLVLWDCHC